jgi:hypothetical protein
MNTKKALRTFSLRLRGEKQRKTTEDTIRKTTEDTEFFHREHGGNPKASVLLL